MSRRKSDSPPHPVDEGWSWFILAAAAMATFLWGGVVRGFGVLFVELKTEFRMTTFLLSLVVALHVVLFTVGGLLSLTYGVRFLTTRQCVSIGAVLAVMSFIFTSMARDGLLLFFSYSVILGLSFSIVIGPSTLLVSQYFQEKRNFATWCIQISPCVGALLFAPLQRSLIDKYFLKGSLLIIAGILSHLLLVAVVMRPPELYKKWQKLKRRIEKNRLKASLLGKDAGMPLEPFRPRSPTSDSTFSPLARQAMLQRMKSRNDDDEDKVITHQVEKTDNEVKSNEKEQKTTNKTDATAKDDCVTNVENSKLKKGSLYGSYEFGISTPFLEQRYASRKRTESDRSNKSESSFLSENSTSGKVKFKKCFNGSIISNLSFVFFTVGFSLGISNVILVLFLPDVGLNNDLNDTQSASLVSSYMIGEIIGRAAAIFLSYKHKDDFVIIITSLVIAGIFLNLLRYFVSFFPLLLFSFVIGVCGGPVQSLYANVMRRSVNHNEVSSGIYVLDLAQGLSWSVTLPIAGVLRDSTGNHLLSFHLFGSLAIASAVVIVMSRICLKSRREEVFHPDLETGELESLEIIIK